MHLHCCALQTHTYHWLTHATGDIFNLLWITLDHWYRVRSQLTNDTQPLLKEPVFFSLLHPSDDHRSHFPADTLCHCFKKYCLFHSFSLSLSLLPSGLVTRLPVPVAPRGKLSDDIRDTRDLLVSHKNIAEKEGREKEKVALSHESLCVRQQTYLVHINNKCTRCNSHCHVIVAVSEWHTGQQEREKNERDAQK